MNRDAAAAARWLQQVLDREGSHRAVTLVLANLIRLALTEAEDGSTCDDGYVFTERVTAHQGRRLCSVCQRTAH